MANLPESPQFDSVYQVERSDKWDTANDDMPNKQAKALTNRTRYLKDTIDAVNQGKVNLLFEQEGTVTAPNTGTVWHDGTSFNWVHSYPVSNFIYTTPATGGTRQYEITVTFFADFTYNAAGNVRVMLFTTTPGPAFSGILTYNQRHPFQHVFYKRVVSIPSDTRIALIFENNSTGANALFSNLQVHIRQL